MKNVIVENFDGETMSVIVGDRYTINESAALNLVADINARTVDAASKEDSIAALQDKIAELSEELAANAPALEADTAEAKTLVLNFVQLCRKSGISVLPALTEFVADIDEQPDPPEVAETVTDIPAADIPETSAPVATAMPTAPADDE